MIKPTAAIAALLLASSALISGCSSNCPTTHASLSDDVLSAFDLPQKGGGGGGGGGHGGGGGGHSGGDGSSSGGHSDDGGAEGAHGTDSNSFFGGSSLKPGQPGYHPTYPWYLFYSSHAQQDYCKKQPQH